jgi:hypothetical protein
MNMKRRDFFKTLATAAAGFAILPSAATYKRTWVPRATSGILILNPDYINAPYELAVWKLERTGQFFCGWIAREKPPSIWPTEGETVHWLKDPLPIRAINIGPEPQTRVVPFIYKRVPKSLV